MKNKMYSNPPRKPMMYGGMAMPQKKMVMDDKGKMMYGGKARKK